MILQFTPDRLGTGDPFVSLAAAILHAIPETQQKALATRLREESDLLGRLLPRRTLIFIDQFEELFTTIQPSLRVPFVAMLKQLVLAAEMRVVITVRADFYANCVEMETLAHIIEHTTFPLSAPGVAALYDMITRPAARAALTFEEGLAQRILDDTGQAPGALALMAYTLDELYRRGLSHAAYEELGGVQGAIGKRSETMFLFLGEEEKAALPSVFRELVEVDERGTATRQRAPLARVASTPAARRLTDALTDARLLVQSRSENNEPVVEVAHEALFRTWLRLAEWIRDAADDLRLLRQVRTAAIEWDRNGRRVDFLWSHERLAPAYALRDRMGIEFDDITSEFIRPEYERLAEQFRTDQREFRQRSCVERLIEIGPPAAGALVGSLQHASTEATRRDIVTALGVLGQAAVPHLIDACLAERFKNRDAVLDALVRMRTSPGTAALEHLLEDKDVHIRVDAIRLAAITAHQDAIPSLARRFNDYVSDVRILAMLAVATFDSHQALATLESTLTRDASWSGLAVIEQLVFRDQAESDLLSTLEPPMRQVAESLLALISTNDMRHAEAFAGAIIPMLDDVEHPLFKTALRILIGSGSPTALRAVLNTTREHCSSYVLRTMRRSVRSRMMPALMDLLDAPESHVRASAARMLRQLATSGDLQFQDALHQYDGVSRLLRLTNDKDAEVSLSALTVLAAVRSIEAREVFRQYLSSPVDRIRRVAIQGLGRLGHLSAVPDLIAGLHDSFNGARIAAAIALVKLGAEKRAASEALAILARIADSAHDSDFKSVLIHIASAAPSPTFEEVLRRVQKSPSGAAVRVAARKLKSSGH
jgi:HEAT repeat protein